MVTRNFAREVDYPRKTKGQQLMDEIAAIDNRIVELIKEVDSEKWKRAQKSRKLMEILEENIRTGVPTPQPTGDFLVEETEVSKND